jgi:hypothetical protein
MKKLPLIAFSLTLSLSAAAQHKAPRTDPKCYRHKLEQGGSPKRPTVLVCPVVIRGGK